MLLENIIFVGVQAIELPVGQHFVVHWALVEIGLFCALQVLILKDTDHIAVELQPIGFGTDAFHAWRTAASVAR